MLWPAVVERRASWVVGCRFSVAQVSVVQDDDVLARRGAGLDVGLGVTDLFQAVVDLRDRDFETPCGDGLELAGEDVGREVGGLTAVGRQAHPVGIMNGVKSGIVHWPPALR